MVIAFVHDDQVLCREAALEYEGLLTCKVSFKALISLLSCRLHFPANSNGIFLTETIESTLRMAA